MKMSPWVLSVLLAGAAGGGWLARPDARASIGTGAGRKIQYYQSPMHPWIKSPGPGDCTICGMKLVPVYEGEKALEKGMDSHLITLQPRSINVLHVATARVSRQPLNRSLKVAGRIEENDTRHRRLSTYVDGRLEKLLVEFVGAEVVEGEVLAHVFSPALLSARDEYLLLGRQTPGPDRERLLASARQRLVRMGLSVAQVAALSSEKNPPNALEIVAPLGGTVLTRNVYEGQYVREGDVLFEIGDFSKMWFVADVYERDMAWVQLGQKVDIVTPSLPGQVFHGSVDFVDPNIASETRSAKMRVVLENPLMEAGGGRKRRALQRRVFAEGLVHLEMPEVLVVPRTAVLSPGAAPMVYVQKAEGVYERRPVRLGRSGDGAWEVLGNLEEGEVVVTTGNLLIDAQAQLDHGDHAEPLLMSAAAAAAPAAAPVVFSAEQTAAAHLLFNAVDGVAGALAADDLKTYNATLGTLQSAAAELAKCAASSAQPFAPFPGHARDLATARADFLPLSTGAVALAISLRKAEPTFAGLKVFECAMVKAAVPTAPGDNGRWVQLRGPLRNPFFGAEMPGCGVLVEP